MTVSDKFPNGIKFIGDEGWIFVSRDEQATSSDPANQFPGGMTFTCLSHDIIAHETTHAILDGMHRRFGNPTNYVEPFAGSLWRCCWRDQAVPAGTKP